MRRGVCIKCGTATVRAAANGIPTSEQPDTFLRPHVGPEFKEAIRRRSVDMWAFACTSCGYVELHLIDPRAIEFITESWVEVPPAE